MEKLGEIWGASDVIKVPYDPKKAYEAGLKMGIDHNFQEIRKWRNGHPSLAMHQLLADFTRIECDLILRALACDFVFFMGNPDLITELAVLTHEIRSRN